MGQGPSAQSKNRSGRQKYPALFEIRIFTVHTRPHRQPITRARKIQFTHMHTHTHTHTHTHIFPSYPPEPYPPMYDNFFQVPPVTFLSVSFIFPIHATCPTNSQSLIRVNLL